jgi:pilus assembly protein TadC
MAGANDNIDPVAARRAKIARASAGAQRLGFTLLGLAVVGFVAALVTGFAAWTVTLTTAALLLGSIVLLPAIVFSLAARAAEREERTGSDGH